MTTGKGVTMQSKAEWARALGERIRVLRGRSRVPSRSSLSPDQEQQCRILAGHLAGWLRSRGPELLAQREAMLLTSGFEPSPVIVYVTDTPGLVAARLVLGEQDGVVLCLRDELERVPEEAADLDYRLHCELHSYFETSLPADRARELRRLHSLDPGAELCVHHTCSIMGPLCVQGEKHLWLRRHTGELVLVQRAFERWLS